MISKTIKRLKRFCKNYTEIENYDKAIADTIQTWDCHHRLELIETGGVVDALAQDLIDWGIYYNRPADELIFLTHAEHMSLHNKNKKVSEETKKRMSESAKKRDFGYLKVIKRAPVSEETKAKLSAAHKGKKMPPISEETREKMKASRKAYIQNRTQEQIESNKNRFKGKTWKIIDGKRVWIDMEAKYE